MINNINFYIIFSKQIQAAIKTIESEIDDNNINALSRIKRIQFLMIKDFYLKTFREHEEFVCAYEEKVRKISQMEAKISMSN